MSAYAPHVVAITLGRKDPKDPQFDRLWPADLGMAAQTALSLVTLRSHSCRDDGGNAPCFVHVSVKFDTIPRRDHQPQEPLSIVDHFSPMPRRTDHERYRNFAAAPFALYTPGDKYPAIAWTRRDENYRESASLRRAAVEPNDPASTDDDKAFSLGSVSLADFREDDEPAMLLTRRGPDATVNPTVASFSDSTPNLEGGVVQMRQWPLPAATHDADGAEPPVVNADAIRCRPGLEAEWLLRPPQVLGLNDGSCIAVFSRVRTTSGDKPSVALQLALLGIDKDGSCKSQARRMDPIPLLTESEVASGSARREALIRLNHSPLILADLDGDDVVDITLAGDLTAGPRRLCSLTDDGICLPPAQTKGQ
ncbi:hypothetical protein ACO2RV_24975 [Ancylobacter sp. VNQ12]|uniref:hypothetical protein n=1 Tax=Ancylobacter sp. VNQ12 TaxID=3400920 RepID=UPI003BFECCB0